MRFVELFFLAIALTVCVGVMPANAGDPQAGASSGDLELEAALALALERSPALTATAARVRQAEARRRQAAARPNPELQLELEDFAGSGAFHGADEAQATVMLGQVLELGGKRGARLDAAAAGESIAALDYERERLAVVAETSRAFAQVLAAQSELALADESVRIDEAIVGVVAKRVGAGSSSRVELAQADVAVAEARFAHQRASRALTLARHRLAATWGEDDARFERVVGNLGAIEPPPALEPLLARVDRSPDLLRSAAEVARREAGLALEERRAIPDIEVGLGYRRLAGPDDDAMVASLRVPLPLFDRNRGATLDARERVALAETQRTRAAIGTAAAIRAAHDSLGTAFEEVRALDATVLPAATTAFTTIRDGYHEGRFSYLDLLNAEQTLGGARRRRIEALTAYHAARAELARVLGEGDLP